MHEIRPSHGHGVKFYADTASLFETVGGFLSQGLVDGHPAVVIATADHTRGILEDLDRRMINVAAALRRAELLLLDADRALAAFVAGDRVDVAAFERTVGATLYNLVRTHRGTGVVRAYGEMVDLLWKQGRHDAAIRVEMAWNQLAGRCSFSLLCGYAMGSFYKETELFERVCHQHTHVLPPFDVPEGSATH